MKASLKSSCRDLQAHPYSIPNSFHILQAAAIMETLHYSQTSCSSGLNGWAVFLWSTLRSSCRAGAQAGKGLIRQAYG